MSGVTKKKVGKSKAKPSHPSTIGYDAAKLEEGANVAISENNEIEFTANKNQSNLRSSETISQSTPNDTPKEKNNHSTDTKKKDNAHHDKKRTLTRKATLKNVASQYLKTIHIEEEIGRFLVKLTCLLKKICSYLYIYIIFFYFLFLDLDERRTSSYHHIERN
jgi:hypothetical protein